VRASRNQQTPPDVPWLSWSLLAAIPKARLLAIARQAGRYDPIQKELPPGRIAEELLDVKREVVGLLTTDELAAVADRLGIVPENRKKRDMARQLLRKRRASSALHRYHGLPKELDEEENADLRAWVDYYLRNAEFEGYAFDFSDESPGNMDHESTIRLVCQAWPMVAWPDWLMWQKYGGPVGRGPWWICDFEEPTRWFGAHMIIRDPWDFSFSNLFSVADEADICFRLFKHRRKQIKGEEYTWLARAVQDGMREDYDDREFILACTKEPTSLIVRIYNPMCVEMKKSHKRDKDGIFWD
jgi:hypothetical protein